MSPRRLAYLVASTGNGRVVERTRSLGDDADYARIRDFLARRFPGRTIASPLEPFPSGGTVVAVWTSTEPDGVRDASSFHEWALGPERLETPAPAYGYRLD